MESGRHVPEGWVERPSAHPLARHERKRQRLALVAADQTDVPALASLAAPPSLSSDVPPLSDDEVMQRRVPREHQSEELKAARSVYSHLSNRSSAARRREALRALIAAKRACLLALPGRTAPF